VSAVLDIVDDAPKILGDVGELDRRTYLGGSDVAAVLGLDPYGKTPLTVYMSKIGEAAGITDPEKKKFLERRKRWEGPIVQMLREEFDGEIVAINHRYVDDELHFMAAEIDFEWRDADGSIQNGEIKTVSPFAFGERSGWGEMGSDEIPLHYHAQVMHGLGVTGRRTAIVCAMVGLDNMVFYRVERDDEAIAAMRQACAQFWTDHVVPRVPPAPITMVDVAMLYKRHKGRAVELDEEHARALQDLRTVRAAIESHEATKAELELKVALYVCKAWDINAPEEAKDNAALIHDGRELALWVSGRGAHLDQKRLKAEQPDVVKEYTVPHHYRSFRFKKLA
jgi:predicted phage-related endonuclease